MKEFKKHHNQNLAEKEENEENEENEKNEISKITEDQKKQGKQESEGGQIQKRVFPGSLFYEQHYFL